MQWYYPTWILYDKTIINNSKKFFQTISVNLIFDILLLCLLSRFSPQTISPFEIHQQNSS